ncbi:hypothetical protein KIW84_012618 [Lathyrus oleraceus]|uniref:Cellular nucleic acid-binding protein n=1 Tax=Pisum sativum TaxID=3888 RepID=A0A9D5BIB9_PEA|nr:hypothetical protein KIW84_012618 [Pisum sativum]
MGIVQTLKSSIAEVGNEISGGEASVYLGCSNCIDLGQYLVTCKSVVGQSTCFENVVLFLNPKRGRIRGWCWLEFNRVYINCFKKTVVFPEVGAKEDWFVFAKQVDESVQDGAELFMLLANLDIREERTIEELAIVCEFAEVFPEDISDLPPKREVEFSIDLVPGTSPVSMAPYRMSASELKELKS